MNSQELNTIIEFLAQTPERVRELAGDAAGPILIRKPSDRDFSLLENVCHLRDIEREGYAIRIEHLLAGDGPLLPDLDGGQMARERDYNRDHFEDAVQAFTLARAANVGAMRKMSAEDLGRSGTLEKHGPVTLGELIGMMREHDESHLEEMRTLRARFIEGAESEFPLPGR